MLAGVSAAQAASHPIAGAHSIWELVLHIASDYELVLRRLAGDGRAYTAAEDWPACPASTEENWQHTAQELKQLNMKLRQAVRGVPEERLDAPLVPEVPYAAYTQFIGVTQHNLYHAGQIALLRRALAATDYGCVNRGRPDNSPRSVPHTPPLQMDGNTGDRPPLFIKNGPEWICK